MANKPTLKDILPQLNAWCKVNNISVQSVYDSCHGMTLQELVYYLFSVVKQGTSEIVEFEGKFNDLKEFVDNYFENLDIQNEVNNKIDSMIEDGTLPSLITKQFYSEFQTINVLYPPDITDTPLKADWENTESYTDNTEPLQNLINKYGEGCIYYFPKGIYGFSGSINIPHGKIEILGDNQNYTRLRFVNKESEYFISIGDADNPTPLVTIKDIGFIDSIGTGKNRALWIKNPRTILIENILFQDFYNDIFIDAIAMSSGQTSLIKWCTHAVDIRSTLNRFIYLNNASSSIFPNGFYITHNHGSFNKLGEFVSGFVCDLWISENNIAFCKNAINISAANQRIGGNVQIHDNVFADCTGTPIYLKNYNRGVLIRGNFIEENAGNTSIFSAIRLSKCNGVIIASNSVGTERTAIGLNHNIGFVSVDTGTVYDVNIENNICYLGAYAVSLNIACKMFNVNNNIFKHVGSNAVQANAFYINNLATSLINNNTIDYDNVNSTYTLTSVYCKDNLYRGVINTPFEADKNYLYST